MNFVKNNKGISLPQLIVTIAVMGVLSAAVYSWVDPVARIGESKNKKRIHDVNLLASAIFEYAADHNGNLPILGEVTSNKKTLCNVQSGDNVTCDTSTAHCLSVEEGFFDYMGALPIDPDWEDKYSGYYLQKDANNNLIVGSCDSYNGEDISKKPNIKVNCDLYGGGNCWYISATDKDCDSECSVLGLDCVSGASYGPDIDSGDNYFCALQKNINKAYCSGSCNLAGPGVPPSATFTTYVDCFVQTGALNCFEDPKSGYYSICPCE